jgi:hypothetical protein
VSDRQPGGEAAALAQAAAEAIRGLNHATRAGDGLGQDPAAFVSGAGLFLDGARMSAAALAGDLDAAQQLALVNGTPRKDQP